jgi:ketosteroid isomerase-like protein/quercetin dioxygenase-like cupin family protein
MSRFPWVAIALASLAVSAACRPTVNVEQERTALMSADREWSQTSKDPDKFAEYFAEDAVSYPPGMSTIKGREAIRKTFTEMMKAPGFALSWTATKADVAASGDIGHTAGTYEMSMGGPTEKGKYFTAWKKVNGAWKVTDDIFNADEAPSAPGSAHVMMTANALKWSDAPPGLPAGARVAVVSGDASQSQPYVLRAQLPANYRIPPHWHPTTENITVLSGTVAFGNGDTFDEPAMEALPAGGFASVPANMHHFFMAKTPATIQVHGIGPFAITYVNAKDDPRTKSN